MPSPPGRTAIVELLESCGLRQASFTPLTGGVVTLYQGDK